MGKKKFGESPSLKITTLGGLSIQKNGESVTGFHSRKVEALLVYLAVTARPQPREVLGDLLWDEFSQGQAMNNLRVVLSNLRKHLGDYLSFTRDKVYMNLEEDYYLDVTELEAHLHIAHEEEPKMGILHGDAVEHLESAADLYQGEFLAGFYVRNCPVFDAWLVTERERLHQMVLDSLGKLVRWKLAQGEYTAGIRYATRWMQLDPLSEAAHLHMMRLLAFNGQRGAALEQYEKCREMLAEEFGIEPDKKTTAFYERIKAGEVGSEVSKYPPIPPLEPSRPPAPHHNLPRQSTPFIGRETEMAALDELMMDSDVRLVTIVGSGGMGKTRLALESAERQLNHTGRIETHPYRDGIYFVPLAPVSTPDKILLALAEQLEILFHGDSDPADQILEFLRMQRLLLIFDNFEHLITGAEFIAAILQQAPQVTILVTSRERLLIAGEAVLWLEGLSYPDEAEARLTTPDRAAVEYGAMGLFMHHARLIRPDLEFDPARLVEVARICKLVQGMPLAIILAASWIEALSLYELGEAIANSIDILASEQRDLPPRQRSIRAAFETSWTRLTPADQAVFTKLSVFRGGFTHAAAETVAGASLFTLRALIEKSLIAPPNQDRYELHELLRQFAEEKLAESSEMDLARQAHGQYYLSELKVLEADVKGQRLAEAVKEIEADLSNLRHAWGWALAQARFSLIDAALETLTLICICYDWQHEGHMLYQAARERLRDEKDERLLGRLLARHAWLKSELGLETGSIEADLDRSWAIAKQLGDQWEMALVLLAKGWYLTRIHVDLAAALMEFERSYQIFKRLDDRFYMAILLGRIGYCQADQALYIDFTRQSLALALETGNDYQTTWAQHNLGAILMHRGDLNSGEQMLLQTLSIRVFHTTSSLLALAGFLHGDLDQMKKYLPPHEIMVIGKVNQFAIAYTTAVRALLAVVTGDLEIAEQLANQSLNFPSNDNAIFLAHWALAMVSLDNGNLADAKQHLSFAYRLPMIMRLSAHGVMTRSLPVAALILAKSDQPERAAQILSLAYNHPASQIGWLRHWETGAGLREELEQTLGAAAFKEAWDQGKSLDLVETYTRLASELTEDVMVSSP